MANRSHIELLRVSRDHWKQWRSKYPTTRMDLSGANLRGRNLRGKDLLGANLCGADLHGAHLNGAILSYANFSGTDLSYANLSEANLKGAMLSGASITRATFHKANLSEADLSGLNLQRINLDDTNLAGAHLSKTDLSGSGLRRANLSRADLTGANLSDTDLSGADLSGADLSYASLGHAKLIGTNLENSLLTNCSIYGISVWDAQLNGALQFDLVVTPPDQPTITVDNLKVAQFIYLLLNNKDIRDIIETITSKVVLILGRFTPERKAVLDGLRGELRKHNYIPVLFDFEKPISRDLTETVSTLAHIARFVVVDLTDPSSAPHEVATVIPHTVVPVLPLLSDEPLLVDGIAVERREYAMFEDLRRRHHWVLPTFRYQNTAELLASLQEQIIAPAEQKAKELMQPE